MNRELNVISTACKEQSQAVKRSFTPNRTNASQMTWWGRLLAVVTASTVLATSAFALSDDSIPNDQSNLQPIVNKGGTELKFDWPMIRIGTA
jgi:hypothetical protein